MHAALAVEDEPDNVPGLDEVDAHIIADGAVTPDARKDEDRMLVALQQFAHKVNKGKTGSQTSQRPPSVKEALFNQRLTPEQVQQISAAVAKGEIQLPNMSHLDNADLLNVWSLGDSGSAAFVADKEKHFPGATLRESEGQKNGITFQAADGGEI